MNPERELVHGYKVRYLLYSTLPLISRLGPAGPDVRSVGLFSIRHFGGAKHTKSDLQVELATTLKSFPTVKRERINGN
jgi:hypothetical protein